MSKTTQQNHTQGVLVVDDDVSFLEEVRRTLHTQGITNITTLQDSSNVFNELASGSHSVLILDWVMPGLSGADLLPEIVRQYPYLPVIILTGVSDLENVVNCIKQGAYDYIIKSRDDNRLVSVVQKAFKSEELASQNKRLTGYLQGQPLEEPDCFSDIITCSDRMQALFKIIESMRHSRQPVLITGETGAGKELIAQAIHRVSGLRGPMITVNVAGLDDNMFADTLFGHKKGAFTGATDSREGLIEKAKGGTLFLDEIGELSVQSQVKLLRLIQQNEYYRVGSDVLQKNNARIVAASNAHFEALFETGAFRQDLYYRISAHALHVPPLRERREDILPLAEHYAARIAAELKKGVPKFSREVRQALRSYDFTGNVRELINRINNAVTHNCTGTLQLDDFPGLPAGCGKLNNMMRRIGSNQFILHSIFSEFPTFDEIELLLAEEAMEETQGNRSAAAEMLGISRPTLQKKLEQSQNKKWCCGKD